MISPTTKGHTVVKHTVKKDSTYMRIVGSSRYYIEVKAGDYDAVGYDIGFSKILPLEEAYWVVADLPGVCVGGHLPCGDIDKVIGQPMTHSVQVYGYAIRDAVDRGSDYWSVVEELENV